MERDRDLRGAAEPLYRPRLLGGPGGALPTTVPDAPDYGSMRPTVRDLLSSYDVSAAVDAVDPMNARGFSSRRDPAVRRSPLASDRPAVAGPAESDRT